ncbi:hypothetical protein J0383_09065 [Flavobacterium endoglycinae]|uniref:Uncharacterized protein n=1 Tax=Flavobacterium endoglycinae TaxID=2816357 RepID=A0ABX7QJZ6_9FLAO|nr:hypothetical protein [Flavobacterium endoglycinae]QSW90943.1 hypothetical protein J0383_09065 [Flavobacterium endoglycinae]
MINEIRDSILFINPDNNNESIIFNLKSWIRIIEAIIEKYANKTYEESRNMVLSSSLIKNLDLKNYHDLTFYSHETEYHWAMMIAYGNLYWKKGINSDEPEDFSEWENKFRKDHNLAEESFVFNELH